MKDLITDFEVLGQLTFVMLRALLIPDPASESMLSQDEGICSSMGTNNAVMRGTDGPSLPTSGNFGNCMHISSDALC